MQDHLTAPVQGGASTGMPFNINNYVYVQLTDHGRGVHAANHAMLLASIGLPHIKLPYRPPAEDADGWSKWQLWELMSEFGQHTRMGGEACFSTIIVINTKPL